MPIAISNNFQKALVSVIIPTKNRALFLREAIQSVEQQKYRPIELIVIDDGSTDQTKEIIDILQVRYSQNDNFTINYFYQDAKGAPSARNMGLIQSKGEFIQYLDSDDLLHPLKFKIQVAALNSNGKCDYVWSNHEIFEDSNNVCPIDYRVDALIGNEKKAVASPIMSIPNTCWSGLYRRSLCIDTGFWNEDLVRWQDFEYNVRVSYLKPLCKYIDAKLYFWRTHPQGRIADLSKNRSGIQQSFKTLKIVETFLLNKNIEFDSFILNRLWWLYFVTAREALENGTSEQVHHALKACVHYRNDFPFRVRVIFLRLMLYIFGQNTSSIMLSKYSSIRVNSHTSKST